MSSPSRIPVLKILASLVPVASTSVFFFGMDAVRTISVCAIVSFLCEYAANIVLKSKRTAFDGTSVLTGILLALSLPPGISCLYAILGSMFAILVVKIPFGEQEQTLFNPVMAARTFLLTAFTAPMATWPEGAWNISAGDIETTTSATPLTHMKFDLAALDWSLPEVAEDLFFGYANGSLGETSALAILAGGTMLFATKAVSPAIPLSFVSTVALFSLLCGSSPVLEILSGGLLLGAFFLAPCFGATPSSVRGKIIFGFGCGIITMLIRKIPGSGFPEGVAFAILAMNAATPLIDILTSRKTAGGEA
jgi:electron transport complex protein RnfD